MKMKKESGQAIVEFAVILPVLLTLFLAMIDFGLIFISLSKVQYASEEGARTAGTYAARLSGEALQESVETVVFSNIGQKNENDKVSIYYDESGTFVTVAVRHDIKCATFITSAIYGEYYTSKSESTAVILPADTEESS